MGPCGWMHSMYVSDGADHLTHMVAHHEEAVAAARQLQRSNRPQMRDLSRLSGDALDETFLQDMIPHHMVAVMMSQQLLASGRAEHPEVAGRDRLVLEVLSRSVPAFSATATRSPSRRAKHGRYRQRLLAYLHRRPTASLAVVWNEPAAWREFRQRAVATQLRGRYGGCTCPEGLCLVRRAQRSRRAEKRGLSAR
ncbi:DUF305 domain-containing protein [Nonomuraea sp. CA-141351]|uniref:DUF305 domain-containing protein n=1 Tax=Nonomuraea sp. CA-141351 TaxID=3239996 RepID=UPI003D93C617